MWSFESSKGRQARQSAAQRPVFRPRLDVLETRLAPTLGTGIFIENFSDDADPTRWGYDSSGAFQHAMSGYYSLQDFSTRGFASAPDAHPSLPHAAYLYGRQVITFPGVGADEEVSFAKVNIASIDAQTVVEDLVVTFRGLTDTHTVILDPRAHIWQSASVAINHIGDNGLPVGSIQSITILCRRDMLIDNVTILVNATPPTVVDWTFHVPDFGSTTPYGPRMVEAPGVLAGATSSDDEFAGPLEAYLVDPPVHGRVTLNFDGSFRYDPPGGFMGVDTFTFFARNHFGDSNLGTVTMRVSQISAEDDFLAYRVSDTPSPFGFTFGNFLANDTGLLGFPVVVTDPNLSVEILSLPRHGVLSTGDDFTAAIREHLLYTDPTYPGDFHYAPDRDYRGVDSFQYRFSYSFAGDGGGTVTHLSNIGTGRFHLFRIFAREDEYDVPAGGRLLANFATRSVLDNDTVEGVPPRVELVRSPHHGSLTLFADGSFDYTPDPGFQGDDSFEYDVLTPFALSPVSADDARTVAVLHVEPWTHDVDFDGVNNTVEDGAANDGDGNFDGILDSEQAEVASLPNAADGRYVTLEAAGGTLAHVQAVSLPPATGEGPALGFPLGFFSFELQPSEAGGAASVRIFLPSGVVPSAIYKQGPTPEFIRSHLYPFDFDGATGAQITPLVDLVTGSFSSARVLLHFVDGQRGDSDMLANGVIIDPVGPAFSLTAPADNPGNAQPESLPDTYTVVAGHVLHVSAAEGILRNDADPDGDSISAVSVENYVEPIGGFDYESDPGFVGTDTFRYQVLDLRGGLAFGTVSIEVLDPALYGDAVNLFTASGSHAVLLSSPGTTLANVQLSESPPAPPPADVEFPLGYLGFEVHGLTPGGSATVTLRLPEDAPDVDSYWKYFPDGPESYWYEFSGAEIRPLEREILLHLVDGGAGDNDGIPNGVIVDPGGPALRLAPPATVEHVRINDGSAQRSKINSLTVTFDGQVTLDSGAFELQGVKEVGAGRRRRSVNFQPPFDVAVSAVNGQTVAVLTFSGPGIQGGSLPDAIYTLSIHGDRVHDLLGQALDGDGDGLAGGNAITEFFRRFGDADGDGDVDGFDGKRFDSAVRKTPSPGYLWYFDFEGDGDVDARDRREFKVRRTR